MEKTVSFPHLDQGSPPFLNERELARRWNTSPRTLQRWRAEDQGPAFLRIGGSVRYRLSDILAYEERHRHAGGTL